ncbi:hlyD secretion family protein [Brucella abortus]|nr:hlyD secretion family protein [Brucella abortus]
MKIHMNPMFRAAGCAVLFGALTVLAACGKEDEKAQEAAPIRPVLYTIVEPKPVAQTGFAGTVEPRYSTDLAFRVLGRVIARPVKVGDLVKKGEMVAMLDPSALDLAVQSARADLASAEAQYANASASEDASVSCCVATMFRRPIMTRPGRRATAPRQGWKRRRPVCARPKTSGDMPCCVPISMA